MKERVVKYLTYYVALVAVLLVVRFAKRWQLTLNSTAPGTAWRWFRSMRGNTRRRPMPLKKTQRRN